MLLGSEKMETSHRPQPMAVEECPLCGTELSRIKFREIQSKLREQEERKTAELSQAELATRQRLEHQFKLDLERQKQLAEKRAKEQAEQQIKTVAAERDQAAQKLKEAQGREAEIRMQAQKELEKAKVVAERKAKEEFGDQIKKASAEAREATKKLKEAEAREAATRKRVLEEAEVQRQKELAQQRQALEKDRDAALIKQQAEFNRQRQGFQKRFKSMEQQLVKKTANELGDGAEIDLFEALRGCFDDKISRIPKGQAGADILLEVLYKGESCGKIIIDSKNRQGWKNEFVPKLRLDQVNAKAEHAILATTVFPEGKKEMCIESGVIVIAPARVVHIVQLLRDAMVTMHVKGLSLKERSSKMTRLYKLITSESYSRKFLEAGKLTEEILELDVQEKKAHDNVWKKRGTLAIRINNVLREVETEVAAVIEGCDEADVPPAFRARGDGSGAKIGEAAAWSKH
jgi:hypothetical protein